MKKKSKEAMQICPQCGSPNIETDFSNAGAISLGFIQVKKCNNCGHTGTFFPKIPADKVKKPLTKKQAKNISHVDTSFAKGYFKIQLWFYFLVFILLAAMFAAFKETRNYSIIPLIISLICLFLAIFLPKKIN